MNIPLNWLNTKILAIDERYHKKYISSELRFPNNSGEVIKTYSFISFKTHHRDFDLFMARQRNLHADIIDWNQSIISKGGIAVITVENDGAYPPQLSFVIAAS